MRGRWSGESGRWGDERGGRISTCSFINWKINTFFQIEIDKSGITDMRSTPLGSLMLKF